MLQRRGMLVRRGQAFGSLAELRRASVKPDDITTIMREVKTHHSDTRVWVPNDSINRFQLGSYSIVGKPMMEQAAKMGIWRLYSISLDGVLIGTQISRPSLEDCETHRRSKGLRIALRHRLVA